jgi:CubicO group peptidase (beta-lactamase class C family)
MHRWPVNAVLAFAVGGGATGDVSSGMVRITIKATSWLVVACTVVLASGCAARRALPTARPEAVGLSRAGLAQIRPALQAYVDSGKLAGVVAVIARDGRIAYEETVGWMDVDRRIPMKRDAVFRIYSMTKPIVAAGVLALVDQGKLELDDPVSKYIPAFAHVKVFAGGSATAPILRDPDSLMTVRQLLIHTSGLAYGLTRGPVDTIFRGASMYNASRTLEQFADSIARLPLLFSPGTDWSYSSGIDVAGRVIEVASGQTLDVFLDQHIFRPLGMRKTAFRKRNDMKGRIATLYARGPDGRLRVVSGENLQLMYEPEARFLWGSGGLLSTIDDYLRFAQMLLNRGELDGKRVLSRESVETMITNQLPPHLASAAGPPMIDRGYGFGLAGSVLLDSEQTDLPDTAGIYRWSGYVGTYFWIDPRNRMIAMVWTQFTPGRTYPLEDDFQKLVYGAIVPR